MRMHSKSGSKNCTYVYYLNFRAEYEHPLVIGNVRRKARTLGVEVKTVNDWTQFVEDKEVQGILFSANERFRKSGFFQMSEEFKVNMDREGV